MNQKMIWGVTAGVAVLMLIGALYVASQRSTQAPANIATTITQNSAAAPAVPQPSATPAPVASPAKQQVYDEVKLDLSRIAGQLQMSSPDIHATATGELPRYPIELTCYRRNASPTIQWRNAPSATKSFMLVLERRAVDEKASWSWIVYNIPATSNTLASNVTKDTIGARGVFGSNHYGHQAYTGPCEPKGIYPYVLRLLALDTTLTPKDGATLQDLLPLINGHIIDAAEIRAHHYLQM